MSKSRLWFLAKIAIAFDCTRLDWTAETTNPTALDDYRHLGAAEVSEKIYFRLAGDDLATFANDT